jgi:hypothetical protein
MMKIRLTTSLLNYTVESIASCVQQFFIVSLATNNREAVSIVPVESIFFLHDVYAD